MSVNAVDQTTGNTTPLAGNTNNLVGNLSALTTNTKSDAVGAINEVNQTKQNATDNNLQTTDKNIVGGINELKSGLTNLVKFVNLQAGQSVTVDGFECLVVAKRQHMQTAYDVNAIMYLSGGTIYAVLNNGGNTTPITVSYDTTNVTTTITNNNGVAINLAIITN